MAYVAGIKMGPITFQDYNPTNHFVSTSQADFKHSPRPEQYQLTPRRTYSEIAEEKFKRKAQSQTIAPPYDQRTPNERDYEQSSREISTTRQIRDPYGEKTVSERKKLEREIEDTRRDRMRHQREQKQRQQWKNQEKYQDLEMLQTYDPFGKPGAGAPQADNKKKRFDLEAAAPIDDSEEAYQYGKGFTDGFGRPGAGAPRRTGSGKPITNLKGDGSIRFGHGNATTTERYKTDGNTTKRYAAELQQQMRESREQANRDKHDNLQRELDMNNYESFGKPGAGAPMRTQSGNIKAGRSMKDQGTLQKNEVTPKDDMNTYDPWGKGVGAPQRKSDGKVINRQGFLSNEVRHTDKIDNQPSQPY